MQIEKQICSLNLSKQLKEAGYKQEGLWWWYNPTKKGGKFELVLGKPNSQENYIAPTVAELGERLPKFIKVPDWDYKAYWLQTIDVKNGYYLAYECNNTNVIPEIRADTEANARAKMYLHLVKEGLL